MGSVFLSVAVALLAVQCFVQGLVIGKLLRRASALESAFVKLAALVGQVVELQGILINRSSKGAK